MAVRLSKVDREILRIFSTANFESASPDMLMFFPLGISLNQRRKRFESLTRRGALTRPPLRYVRNGQTLYYSITQVGREAI